MLRLLWKSDPFKAKWTILAKAYSIVRDKHPDQVSLDTFLTLNAPIIGIVTPTDYLKVMNMQVIVSADKQYSLVRASQSPTVNQSDLTTNLSADDIVSRCYETGYVARGLSSDNTPNQGSGVAMVVTAQPHGDQDNVNSTMSNTERNNDSGSSGSGETTENDSPLLDGDDSTHGESVDSTQLSDDFQQYPQATNGNTSVAVIGASPNMNAGILNTNHTTNHHPALTHTYTHAYTPAQFEAELRNAMQQFRDNPQAFDTSNDGYYGLFNPMNQPSQIGVSNAYYNPYGMAHNDFDPFDMNDYF